MINLAWIVLGAGIGSLLRFGLQQSMALAIGTPIVGTILANGLGCLAAGFSLNFMMEIPDKYRLLLMTGLLGSLTTLSAFQLEVLQNILSDRIGMALLRWGCDTMGGLFFCWFGYQIGQKFL